MLCPSMSAGRPFIDIGVGFTNDSGAEDDVMMMMIVSIVRLGLVDGGRLTKAVGRCTTLRVTGKRMAAVTSPCSLLLRASLVDTPLVSQDLASVSHRRGSLSCLPSSMRIVIRTSKSETDRESVSPQTGERDNYAEQKHKVGDGYSIPSRSAPKLVVCCLRLTA